MVKPQKFQKLNKITRRLRVTDEHDKQIPKERYMSPEERQKIFDDLKLIKQYNTGISKI